MSPIWVALQLRSARASARSLMSKLRQASTFTVGVLQAVVTTLMKPSIRVQWLSKRKRGLAHGSELSTRNRGEWSEESEERQRRWWQG